MGLKEDFIKEKQCWNKLVYFFFFCFGFLFKFSFKNVF